MAVVDYLSAKQIFTTRSSTGELVVFPLLASPSSEWSTTRRVDTVDSTRTKSVRGPGPSKEAEKEEELRRLCMRWSSSRSSFSLHHRNSDP
eukprot:scaffold2532_cov115-Cylindrotheca_fusiformis.AAC.2